MATREQIENGERRNGYLVGEDGLTKVERRAACSHERQLAARSLSEKYAKKHGLQKKGTGVRWTTAAVADLLWTEHEFMLLSPYVNNGTGKDKVLLFGVCTRCGETQQSPWHSLIKSVTTCQSYECGGSRRMPTYKMDQLFKSRGFELVGDYPTGQYGNFTLRHVGHDPERPGQEPCGQLVKVMWNHFMKGIGCGVCSGYQVIAGYNDIATTSPEVAARIVDQSLVTQIPPGGGHWQLEMRCAVENCDGVVMQYVSHAISGHMARCPDHEAYHRSVPQMHYILPVYSKGNFIGSVWGHVADYKAADRLWKHVKTALAHDLELGDVTLTTGLDKTLAETNDNTPRDAIDDWQSIPKWLGYESPTFKEWDGWRHESAVGVTPDQVERMLGFDKYDPTQHPRVLVPIAEFYEERAA